MVCMRDDSDDRQVFRSLGATIVWWVWAIFALGNLIDLAVQGRDHLSLVAVFILLFVTGIVYVTAKRPRIVAGPGGLTVTNPVRDHQVPWATVAGADTTDLLRVRCEWPAANGTSHQAIYAWAVHSSRRRQFAADLRARGKERQGSTAGAGSGIFGSGAGGFSLGGLGAFGAGDSAPPPEGDPLRLDAAKVAAEITDRAEAARKAAPDTQATAPTATWDWPAVAAVAVPGIALLVVALI
jgi:hypothetical protein